MRPIYAIYIENQLIDLLPNTIISLTLQASDFASGDLTSRKASFTNQVKVPATNNNIRIFEFANNPKSGSLFPYQKNSIKIFCNGIQILEGVVIIKSFDIYFNLQIFDMPKDLKIKIDGLYLSDLDFGDSPITWNQSFMDSKRASTTGWCSPVIDYGQILNSSPGTIGDYNLPSISYKDILTAIIENAGFTVSGDLYDNDITFNNMIMTYGREEWGSSTLKMNEALSTTVLQSDFLSDFLIKFGAFLKITIDNNIEIITLEHIVNDTLNAIDWTNKRVKNKQDVLTYNLSTLAQLNNFNYAVSNDENKKIAIGFGLGWVKNTDGSLTQSNANITTSNDVYTSLFDGPDWNTGGAFAYFHYTIFTIAAASRVIYCMTSPVYTSPPSSFIFDNTPQPRLALLRAKDASEDSIYYNGSLRADYLVGHFSDNYNQSWSNDKLSWRGLYHFNGLLDVYYNSFQKLITNGTKVVTHEYYLTDLDIYNLDLHTLIFDDGSYYLINKIINYISGKTTRVELLKF